MKLLQTIKSESIIAIDIETVRIEKNFEDLSQGYQSAWEYKNKQDGVIPDFKELSQLWEKNASLYAEFSKICAVSLVFLHGGKLYCKEFYGEDEHLLLESLYNTLENINSKSSDYRLAGHASKFFDYPFTTKRFIINDFDIPSLLDTVHLKPWETKNLCTNELWKVGGTGAGSSLQALCNVLNIPVSKVDLVGDEMGKAYYDGQYERIGRYCSYDTIAAFNILRKLKKESIFQFEDVEYINGIEKKEEIVEQPILEQLYNSKELTEPLKKKLESVLKKQKKTKKDREIIQDILYSLILKSDFDNKDTKADIERKQKEVQEFINGL